MIYAIHQPNYIPYLGFFDKYKKSDIFILYDTAQYSKNEFHNRNRIKTASGPIWLTIPVKVHLGQQIREVSIIDKTAIEKHLGALRINYGQADFFEESMEWLLEIYSPLKKADKLVDVNIPILKKFFDLFKGPEVFLASELGISPEVKSTQALVEMCKKVGADTYLSGSGAKAYLDEELFKKNDIKVIWQEFHHPVYQQRFGKFVPNLSVIDALMNVGKKGLKELI